MWPARTRSASARSLAIIQQGRSPRRSSSASWRFSIRFIASPPVQQAEPRSRRLRPTPCARSAGPLPARLRQASPRLPLRPPAATTTRRRYPPRSLSAARRTTPAHPSEAARSDRGIAPAQDRRQRVPARRPSASGLPPALRAAPPRHELSDGGSLAFDRRACCPAQRCHRLSAVCFRLVSHHTAPAKPGTIGTVAPITAPPSG